MNNAKRFWALEARYQKAKRKAERYLRRNRILIEKVNRQLEIMKAMAEEQEKINKAMAEEDGE